MKGIVLAALLGAVLSACGGGQIGEPGSGEVWIKHRVPSK